MPSWLGTTELIIVLVIVLLIFGAGRIGKIAREFGEGIKSFREGISGGAEPENLKKE
ncbi:twin-arginine translocase TatA/TatE family subunit [bacterium]|nr:twin-arginine translocase TatA/TatE family subunit [bacterium]